MGILAYPTKIGTMVSGKKGSEGPIGRGHF